jgi:4'-phosphopantetheinyl transferase
MMEAQIDHALLLVGPAEGSLEALHPIERALLSQRASAKRRTDFVGGRTLAKEALRRRLGVGEWIIGRDVGVQEGAPIVLRGPQPGYVSISHVDGVIAAVASSAPVAVDLVKREPMSDALRDEAFTTQEQRAWQHANTELACVFAIKEAALKWLRTGMGTGMHELQVFPRGPNVDVHTQSSVFSLSCSSTVWQQWLAVVLYERSGS